MSNFRFRLETLLKLRRAALDQQRAKLAEAYRAEDLLRKQMRDVQHQIDETQADRRRQVRAGAVDVDAALWTQRFELILATQRRELNRQGDALAAAIEQQRQAVIEADREVKVLEKLRERRLTEHRQADAAQEIKQLDEAAARARREAP